MAPRFGLLLCLLLLLPCSLSHPEEEEKKMVMMLWMKSFRTSKDSLISQEKMDNHKKEGDSPSDTKGSSEQVINREDRESTFAVDEDVEISYPEKSVETIRNPGEISRRKEGDSIEVEDFSQEPVDLKQKAVQNFSTLQRIIHGQMLMESAPWMVSVESNLDSKDIEDHVCGGVLIRPSWVLTAAHCLPKASEVRMGNNDLMQQGVTREIRMKIPHPSYDVNNDHHHHDIALLKLNEELQYNNDVMSAELPSRDPVTNTRCQIYGWGRYPRGLISPKLRVANVPVVRRAMCKRAFRSLNITNDQICAGSPCNGADACEGDSGGPLMCNSDGSMRVHGIISYGREYGYNSYGVYSSVYKYKKWIEREIRYYSRSSTENNL